MSVFEVTDKKTIESLFQGWEETMIWSCLENCMGKAYASELVKPKAAQIIIADFCFYGGIPDAELVRHRPADQKSDEVIMVPGNQQWADMIEAVYQEQAALRMRYAIKKEMHIFVPKKLQRIVSKLSPGYEVRLIDEAIYNQIMELKWAQDLCGQFENYEDYQARGIGAAVLRDGQILSGASSYTVYNGGIEIEIDTKQEERRKGFALVCGARLILECLDRKLYPSWDAHNKGSVALAEKLGYHLDQAYPVYEIENWQP